MTAPRTIKLDRKTQLLEVAYARETFQMPAEYLRVHSPSAEVQGHGRGQHTLQFGKKDVAITAIEPQGNYAVRLVFDDGHDTGIYTWAYLYELGSQQDAKWTAYLEQLHDAGKTREPDTSVVKLML